VGAEVADERLVAQCGNCRFWITHTTTDEPGGQCQRYPPLIVEGKVGSVATLRTWWCGEFQWDEGNRGR